MSVLNNIHSHFLVTDIVYGSIILLFSHCLAMSPAVPISVSFTKDWDIAYHMAIQ